MRSHAGIPTNVRRITGFPATRNPTPCPPKNLMPKTGPTQGGPGFKKGVAPEPV